MSSGPIGGFAALIGTLLIMIILSAVLGLVIVNAMKHSPWATSTVFATIPVAIIVGLYLRSWRPGRVLEATAARRGADPAGAARRRLDRSSAVAARAVRLFRRSRSPASSSSTACSPRSCRCGCCSRRATTCRPSSSSARSSLLAIAIVIMHPQIKMPAITPFVDGTRPAVRRQGVSVRVHHHRLRRDLRAFTR